MFTFPKKTDLALVIRGVAAFSVLLWHGGLHSVSNPIAHYLILPGRTAVWIFFAISGYLLTSGFTRGRYRLQMRYLASFYYNRFLRIYPLFLLVSVVSLSLNPHLRSMLNYRFLVDNFFLCSHYNHEYSLNGVFWTLGIEVQFYLLFPLLYSFQFKKKFFPFALYFFICFSLLFLKRFDTRLLGDSRSLLGNLMHFQIGVIIALNRDRIVKIRGYKRLRQFLFFLSFAGLITTNKLYHTRNDIFLGLSGIFCVDLTIAFLISLHVLAEEINPKTQLPVWKVGYLMGLLSYGIYGWHPVLLNLFSGQELSFLALSILTFLTVLASYFILERPLLSLKLNQASRDYAQ